MWHELGQGGVDRSDPTLLLAGDEQGGARRIEGSELPEALPDDTPELQA